MPFLFYNKAHKSDQKISTTNTLKSEGYIILDHISNGSYGEVRHAKYICEDKELNLVVKIINTNQTSKEYLTKFLPREVDIICKINHPYIIHTHSILQKKAVLFIFMAYAAKGDLLQYIVEHGPLKENHARLWFRQLVLAVQYLHTMDIAHRDIKCENILITDCLIVKLTDFGFSKFIDKSKRLNCNTYCCSVPYASPEVLSTHSYDGKSSDIWSLGVVLYVMLNNKMPFSKSNIKLMYKEQVKQEWNHRPYIEKIISDNVKMCVQNMLQPKPRKRWTINIILNSDWITMNHKLVNMNEQELLAFMNAQHTNRTLNKNILKKIEAKRSDTQQILNKQSPKFSSAALKMESTIVSSKEDLNNSVFKDQLKRSKCIMHASNILVSHNSSKIIK